MLTEEKSMKENAKKIISLIATPISAVIMLILVRSGDKFLYIYHNTPDFPKEFFVLHIMAFVLIAPLLMAEFLCCQFAYQSKPFFRYFIATEKILVIALLIYAIPMLAINSNGREMWGLLVGYEFSCAILLIFNVNFRKLEPRKIQ